MLVHLVVKLCEREVSEEAVRLIFESEFTDLKTKAFEYFLQVFSEDHGVQNAERIARVAVSLIEPLTKKQEDKVKTDIRGAVAGFKAVDQRIAVTRTEGFADKTKHVKTLEKEGAASVIGVEE